MSDIFCPIPDVQAKQDARRIDINRVGIKGIRHPLTYRDVQGREQSTIATLSMSVNLPHDRKGTHMSRFVQMLNEGELRISRQGLHDLLGLMTERLQANSGSIDLRFTYFVPKQAPVSGQTSLMDYDVTLSGVIDHGRSEVWTRLVVPVTSLCPCSKEIAAYGAHNQRSHITVKALLDEKLPLDTLITLLEAEGSCELYGLLKRADEKLITERAYENPKFVEDMIRDVAVALNQAEGVLAYEVEVENFESIHNHSAYAVIAHDKRD